LVLQEREGQRRQSRFVEGQNRADARQQRTLAAQEKRAATTATNSERDKALKQYGDIEDKVLGLRRQIETLRGQNTPQRRLDKSGEGYAEKDKDYAERVQKWEGNRMGRIKGLLQLIEGLRGQQTEIARKNKLQLEAQGNNRILKGGR
jgi:hypothetical protein